MARIDVPVTIHGGFQGTAKTFQASLKNEPFLIVAALVAIYIVLGVLYESYIHPVTILSALPSAGVGALIALTATGNEFSLTAMIGVLLLIGIVKKNAIMMIDFAIVAERDDGLDARAADSGGRASEIRPILMTTLAAIFGALPLVLASGRNRPAGRSASRSSAVPAIFPTLRMFNVADRLSSFWRSKLTKTAYRDGFRVFVR